MKEREPLGKGRRTLRRVHRLGRKSSSKRGNGELSRVKARAGRQRRKKSRAGKKEGQRLLHKKPVEGNP